MGNTTALSSRLEAVMQSILPCSVLADVGTDHGMVPVAAVRRGLAARAIAADLREAPLLSARALIERARVGDRVIAILGDGLLPLREFSVDAVVMAGMSGDSMRRLCDAAPVVLDGLRQLIVQPNQNVDSMRAWALQNGWHLRDERMVEENRRFFVVCAFSRASGRDPAYLVAGWSEAALCSVGPRLLTSGDAVARRWYQSQRERVAHWVQRGVKRLESELSLWEAACEFQVASVNTSAG